MMMKKICEFVLVIITIVAIILMCLFVMTKNNFYIAASSYLVLLDTLVLSVTDRFHLNLFK